MDKNTQIEPNKKRLQKVTVFEKIKDIDQALQDNMDSSYDILNYLIEQHRNSAIIVGSDSGNEYSIEERRDAGQRLERYLTLLDYTIDKLQGDKNVDSTILETARNWTYSCNHVTIMNVYLSEVYNGYLPTVSDIAIVTGLSRKTVHKHLKSLKESEELKSRIELSQVLIPKVIAKLYKLGMQGNVKALQLLLEYHKEPEKRVSQKNYIQINKLTITEEDILSLPTDKVLQIEGILKQHKG